MSKEEILKVYFSKSEKYGIEKQALDKKSTFYGWLRLVIAVAFLILIFKAMIQGNPLYYGISAALFLIFVFLVRIHRQILWQRDLKTGLLRINQNEIAFLEKGKNPGDDGREWITPEHPYTYDLDIFGDQSLFHHLNRTTVFVGKQKLAGKLSLTRPSAAIGLTQEAIKELNSKTDWRQMFSAYGSMISDHQDDYRNLIRWADLPIPQNSKLLTALSYLLPGLFLGLLLIILMTPFSFKWLIAAFILNMILIKNQAEKIKNEIVESENISEIIKNYGLVIRHIETEPMQSEMLERLRNQLKSAEGTASEELKRLSAIFKNLSGANFDLAVLTLDGSVLYHYHVYRSLLKWKSKNASDLKNWLEVMGELDMLNSLANFSFNNPGYCFPQLNGAYVVKFENTGHPLIATESRICNDIELNKENFMILTGSNMSGKSTFLRTLGINMLLGNMGAPVCAVKASIHPLPIWVSMRQTDSLSSGESYFFAEVKRLKEIIDNLENETGFVLLDEILRGTNSDDKQFGTIGMIKRIISKAAIGGIATHDLEICRMVEDFPNQLQNKNFEVEIVNDELVFDYKLRDGVCKNKSATFLMRKMGIINP